MIEIGWRLSSPYQMEDKRMGGNDWFIRPGQHPRLVYQRLWARHQPHRLDWRPRLNGLLTATGQRNQKCRLVVGVTFRCHPTTRITQQNNTDICRNACVFACQDRMLSTVRKNAQTELPQVCIMWFDFSIPPPPRWILLSTVKDTIFKVSLRNIE